MSSRTSGSTRPPGSATSRARWPGRSRARSATATATGPTSSTPRARARSCSGASTCRSVPAMSTSATGPRERVGELAARVTELRDAYYRGEPLVADAEYDALEDELRTLIAEHPELTPDPNPLEQVGAPAVLHAPVRHSRPMLSLEKANTPEQVAAYFA